MFDEKKWREELVRRRQQEGEGILKGFGVDIQKGQLDKSKLTQKTIIDKLGHQRKVWVRTEEIDEASGLHVVRKQDDVEAALSAILQSDSMKQSDKVRALLDLGMTDKKEIAEMTGAHYSRVHQLVKKHQSSQAKKPAGSQQQPLSLEQQHAAIESLPADQRIEPVSVQERWDSYEVFVDMVAGGMAKSCIAYGTGGVGKTYTMSQVLKKYGMKEYRIDEGHELGGDDYDFVKITGKSTPTAMYKALYEHNGKLIVFDDCDSVLQDETSVNIFKGALDTSGEGTVTYASGKNIKTDVEGHEDKKGNTIVPPRFDFSGRVIFISNLEPSQMPQPLVDSRALAVDLSMSVEDTVQRLRDISDKIPIQDIQGRDLDVSLEDRKAVVDLIDENAKKIRPGKLNARTFINLVKIKKKLESNPRIDWKVAARTMLS